MCARHVWVGLESALVKYEKANCLLESIAVCSPIVMCIFYHFFSSSGPVPGTLEQWNSLPNKVLSL